MAREKGSVVLSPKQAKLVSGVLQQNVAGNLNKQAFGLYGNIYSFPNYGRYSPRWYVQQDTETGLDALSRELLVRWSREICSQHGWVESAIRVHASFTVGEAYLPEYVGNNQAWGQEATEWLTKDFYPNCCNRGNTFDFQTIMYVGTQMLDMDGDFLIVFGEDNGFPKIQLIPSHRIRSFGSAADPLYNDQMEQSPLPNSIISDGVVFDYQGKPLAYNVVNAKNLVNSIAPATDSQLISARNSVMAFDPRFLDKGRGRPTIGSAILQALSLQEIERYLMDKIKIESCVGLVEKTPSGEGPLELQQTLQQLESNQSVSGIFTPSPNVHGVEIVDGPTTRYVRASGGDIATLSSNTPANETGEYITRLETHVLSTLGVPHVLLFSPDEISGRISDGVGEIFNRSISRRQKILDKHGKLILSWALAKAMDKGLISRNDDEDLYNSFNLTHPAPFSLNKGYDDAGDLQAYKAGLKSMNEIAKKRNTTAGAIIGEVVNEQILFWQGVQQVSKATGVDPNMVAQSMKEGLTQKVQPPISNNNENQQK